MRITKTIPQLPARPKASHKGDFGRILVVAGSAGMTGAAYLTAQGALRAGAGLVTVATPKSQQPILAAKLTCAMTAPLPETPAGTISLKALSPVCRLAANTDVITLGPGLSRHPQTVKFVLALLPRLRCPAVVDADALNAIAQETAILKKVKIPLILTPHPGEMTRLTGHFVLNALSVKQKVQQTKSLRVKITTEFARKYRVVVVLKGYQTVVTDGRQVYINHTGNPGMATGGSGDVLTGVIAGLLGQKLSPFAAAQLGVYVHGIAGDLAAERFGDPAHKLCAGLIATDLLDYLPLAFLKAGNGNK